MNLKLEIRNDNKMILQLISDGKAVDCLAWEENNDLSRTLLAKIDEILKKNKITFDNIREYKIISDVPEKWTTYRIADITLKSLALAKKTRL